MLLCSDFALYGSLMRHMLSAEWGTCPLQPKIGSLSSARLIDPQAMDEDDMDGHPVSASLDRDAAVREGSWRKPSEGSFGQTVIETALFGAILVANWVLLWAYGWGHGVTSLVDYARTQTDQGG